MKPMIYSIASGGTIIVTVPAEPDPPPDIGGSFGPGTAGNVVYSVNTTVSADVDADNITINPGITVTLAPTVGGATPRLRATNTFTFGADSILSAIGIAGAGGGSGGAGGSKGGAGGSGAVPPGGTGGASTHGLGGTGGRGSISGTSNPGGTVTSAGSFASISDLVDGEIGGTPITGGSGGGAGYGVSPQGAGGGGGGGVVHLVCNHIVGTGSINAYGGNGGSKGATAGGNGGGGGGGVVIIVCHDIAATININVLAGVFANDTPFAASGTQGRIYVAADDPTQSENWQGMYTGITVT